MCQAPSTKQQLADKGFCPQCRCTPTSPRPRGCSPWAATSPSPARSTATPSRGCPGTRTASGWTPRTQSGYRVSESEWPRAGRPAELADRQVEFARRRAAPAGPSWPGAVPFHSSQAFIFLHICIIFVIFYLLFFCPTYRGQSAGNLARQHHRLRHLPLRGCKPIHVTLVRGRH